MCGSMVEVAEAHPKVGIVAAYELEGDGCLSTACPIPAPKCRAGKCAGSIFRRIKASSVLLLLY